MKKKEILKKTEKQINKLVEFYKEKEIQDKFTRFAEIVYYLLSAHPKLSPYVHTLKFRIKKAESLRGKLIRKAIKARKESKAFDINKDNLFDEIKDIVGVRLLHLHTEQISDINNALKEILEEEKYTLIEGPVANIWDKEYKDFYKGLGIEVVERETMYTSVHYIISSNNTFKTKCEIQVRTLMEEVWGEVTHQINYPKETNNVCCKNQIKVLARTTSSCTRLVDSIFDSHKNHS